MSIEAMKQALEALENASEYIQAEHDQRKEMYEPYGMVHKYSTEAQNLLDNKQAITSLRQAIEQAEKQEKALQSLHNENERLGLYKDAYGKPEKCTYPNCPYPCMDLPDCIEQEPAARAWDEGYRFGVNDERMSEANIGIAGMGMKVEPARNNPYRTTPPQRTEQEPVAYKPPAKWTDAEIEDGYRGIRWVAADGVYGRPSEEDVARYLGYTTPSTAQRPWVGLTDEEMNEAMDYWSDRSRSAYGGAHAADGEYVSMISTWRYIEAKLKEKNT